jgi:hypothetical protein
LNLERVEKIAEAVLYEGYMLYPYRISSLKNRQRWNFGVLYPPSYCEWQSGSEASRMQTECLVNTSPLTRITIKVRFLQIVKRSVGSLNNPGREPDGVELEFSLVDRLELGDRVHQPWQEAFERELSYAEPDLALLSSPTTMTFVFPKEKRFEYLHDEEGQAVGVIVREWEELNGSIQIQSERLRDGVFKLTVRVHNQKSFDHQPSCEPNGREVALLYSMASAHTVLGVEDGEFISLLDPPVAVADLTARCENIGTWPVLAGEGNKAILSSPIILYDHPQIAPESAGNLFDSTEIDEILSLRILTLTDEEKREVRQSDDRAREILDRTENMPEEHIMKLHGVLRGLRPLKEELQ